MIEQPELETIVRDELARFAAARGFETPKSADISWREIPSPRMLVGTVRSPDGRHYHAAARFDTGVSSSVGPLPVRSAL